MKFFNFFFSTILEQTSSSFNKKIQVIELFNRKSLRVNGMTQSGSIVEDIYKRIIPLLDCHSCPVSKHGVNSSGNLYKFMDPRVKPEDDSVIKVLILGFGTGTFAKLISQKYPRANITGIEIDKTIIDLGKKYFETDKISNLKVINADAINFVEKNYYDTSSYHSKFDIIFVDLYKGEKIALQVETPAFLKKVKELLNKNGVIIFNRLNFSSHKDKAQKFKITLEAIFSQVTQLKSYSNIIFLGKK